MLVDLRVPLAHKVRLDLRVLKDHKVLRETPGLQVLKEMLELQDHKVLRVTPEAQVLQVLRVTKDHKVLQDLRDSKVVQVFKGLRVQLVRRYSRSTPTLLEHTA